MTLYLWQLERWPEVAMELPVRPDRDAWLAIGLTRLLWPIFYERSVLARMGRPQAGGFGGEACAIALPRPDSAPPMPEPRPGWSFNEGLEACPEARRVDIDWLTSLSGAPPVKLRRSRTAPALVFHFGIHPRLVRAPELQRALRAWFELLTCCELGPVWTSSTLAAPDPRPDELRELTRVWILRLTAELAALQDGPPVPAHWAQGVRQWLFLSLGRMTQHAISLGEDPTSPALLQAASVAEQATLPTPALP